MTARKYPDPPKNSTLERLHGVDVADPFRPLEAASDPRTIEWVEAENALTRSVLDTPRRTRLAARLAELHRYPRRSLPVVRNGRAFFTENDGTQNQGVLVRCDWNGSAAAGPANRLTILDPNALDPAGTTAITAFLPDPAGRFIVYALSRAGSDIQELIVFDCEKQRDLPDRVRWVKFASIAWAHDIPGFFYTRYPRPGTVPPGDEQYFCQVRFHRLGDAQDADALVYHRPDAREIVFDVNVTSDGRLLVVTSRRGASDNAEVHVARVASATKLEPIVIGFASAWHFVDGRGDTLLFRTDEGAPRERVVAMEVAAGRDEAGGSGLDTGDGPRHRIREIVAETDAKIEHAAVAGGRLLIAALHNASSRLELRDLEGGSRRDVDLPGLGTIAGISGEWDEPGFAVAFTSFTTPPTVLRAGGDGRLQRAFDDRNPVEQAAYATEQVWYRSKDGTPVSMFLVSRPGANGPASGAALLTGYGGFNISLTPQFDPADYPWLDAGGILAVANLRGGGEYGEEWHRAGMRERKQNVFDDFVAAAEWLVASGRAARIGIEGGSNGGLLVGACMVQRPGLFGAVICRVPVADMLRYHLFTVGRFWIPEYGSADDAGAFGNLIRYSPYHNVRDGVAYPPTLVMTADTDDRVDPGMAKKFAARLQEASSNGDVLLRVERRAGHGAGKPIAKQIDEQADICEFLFQHLTPATLSEQ